MPIRAGYDNGDPGGAFNMFDVMDAIYYATNNNADIISMSLGKPDLDCYYGPDFGGAITNAYNNNLKCIKKT